MCMYVCACVYFCGKLNAVGGLDLRENALSRFTTIMSNVVTSIVLTRCFMSSRHVSAGEDFPCVFGTRRFRNVVSVDDNLFGVVAPAYISPLLDRWGCSVNYPDNAHLHTLSLVRSILMPFPSVSDFPCVFCSVSSFLSIVKESDKLLLR
jgi:hypothetical protein